MKWMSRTAQLRLTMDCHFSLTVLRVAHAFVQVFHGAGRLRGHSINESRHVTVSDVTEASNRRFHKSASSKHQHSQSDYLRARELFLVVHGSKLSFRARVVCATLAISATIWLCDFMQMSNNSHQEQHKVSASAPADWTLSGDEASSTSCGSKSSLLHTRLRGLWWLPGQTGGLVLTVSLSCMGRTKRKLRRPHDEHPVQQTLSEHLQRSHRGQVGLDIPQKIALDLCLLCT